MREFSTTITGALTNGLRRDESFRDTMFFADLYNLVPSNLNLRSYQEVTDVLPIAQEDRDLYYPFPQWFRLENDNILVTKDSLYEVIEYANPPFDLKSILLDLSSEGFSEAFEVADYGGDWILLNREGCIYKYDGEVKYSSDLKASSILHYQNRTLIGGGLNGLWTDNFLDELDRVTDIAELEKNSFNLELGKNFIMWSGFDSKYLPMSLLEPEIMFNSFTNDSPFTELLYSNSFGYMEMPFKGAVLDMIESNQQVFVFGEDGLCSIAMNPQATGATFHITGKQPFGIKQRGAVGGDESSFVFIDVYNQLWGVSSQGLEKLDYSEYMEELDGEIFITKDPEENKFYIGDGDTSFLLSNGKLTRIYQTVQSISGAYPYRAGVVKETGDKKARLKSNALDLGNTDLKTLTGVAIGTDEAKGGTVQAGAAVHARRSVTPKVPLNYQGYAAVRIYGRDHQIEIVFDNYKDLNVDHIELKWQIDDRRQRRGTFTTQDSSGAS